MSQNSQLKGQLREARRFMEKYFFILIRFHKGVGVVSRLGKTFELRQRCRASSRGEVFQERAQCGLGLIEHEVVHLREVIRGKQPRRDGHPPATVLTESSLHRAIRSFADCPSIHFAALGLVRSSAWLQTSRAELGRAPFLPSLIFPAGR